MCFRELAGDSQFSEGDRPHPGPQSSVRLTEATSRPISARFPRRKRTETSATRALPRNLPLQPGACRASRRRRRGARAGRRARRLVDYACPSRRGHGEASSRRRRRRRRPLPSPHHCGTSSARGAGSETQRSGPFASLTLEIDYLLRSVTVIQSPFRVWIVAPVFVPTLSGVSVGPANSKS